MDMRSLTGPRIVSHVSPSTWIREAAWAAELVELCGDRHPIGMVGTR